MVDKKKIRKIADKMTLSSGFTKEEITKMVMEMTYQETAELLYQLQHELQSKEASLQAIAYQHRVPLY